MCYVWAAYAAVAALTAAGAYSSAQQQSATAKYNAQVAEQTAKTTENLGLVREYRQRQDSERALSAGVAADAASGFDGGVGTPLLVAKASAKNAEMDALLTRFDTQQTAAGYQSQAALSSYESRAAKIQGMYGVGTSLLGGATAAYSAGALTKAPAVAS